MDTIGAAFGREIHNSLKKLSHEARTERLECAVSMIDELRMMLSKEDHKGAPTGYLTVQGWSELLSKWDHHLRGISSRKIKYTVQFISEVMKRDGMYAPPMGVLLNEMESALKLASLTASSEIQVAA